jgi:Domain of unknown function (DUF4124)
MKVATTFCLGFRRVALATGFVMALIPALAQAQYQWKDDNGNMVYSDRPPPASIKPTQVVKAPSVKVPSKDDAAKDAAAGAKPATNDPVAAAAARLKAGTTVASNTPQSVADKDLESKKKALEAEQADKKRQADSEREARNKAACEDSRASVRTLESGMRVATTNAKGEREFLTDDQRNKRLADLKRDLSTNCKG